MLFSSPSTTANSFDNGKRSFSQVLSEDVPFYSSDFVFSDDLLRDENFLLCIFYTSKDFFVLLPFRKIQDCLIGIYMLLQQ